ncbi:hypothetical protein V8G54_026142 [Vigna mungo]|uniref:Uncharacterized protein n=1 Tax=Vigna mungo TaxID=3915 RepID=A0AAQ3MZV4_VIGMU
MLGRSSHIPDEESYNSADFRTFPYLSLPPAIIAIEPRLLDPNKQRGWFIPWHFTQPRQTMLYFQMANSIISRPKTNSSQPTAKDSLSAWLKHSSQGILGNDIHLFTLGSNATHPLGSQTIYTKCSTAFNCFLNPYRYPLLINLLNLLLIHDNEV